MPLIKTPLDKQAQRLERRTTIARRPAAQRTDRTHFSKPPKTAAAKAGMIDNAKAG
jgi:hypothetical protein